jgi:hypothetical protein
MTDIRQGKINARALLPVTNWIVVKVNTHMMVINSTGNNRVFRTIHTDNETNPIWIKVVKSNHSEMTA